MYYTPFTIDVHYTWWAAICGRSPAVSLLVVLGKIFLGWWLRRLEVVGERLQLLLRHQPGVDDLLAALGSVRTGDAEREAVLAGVVHGLRLAGIPCPDHSGVGHLEFVERGVRLLPDLVHLLAEGLAGLGRLLDAGLVGHLALVSFHLSFAPSAWRGCWFAAKKKVYKHTLFRSKLPRKFLKN